MPIKRKLRIEQHAHKEAGYDLVGCCLSLVLTSIFFIIVALEAYIFMQDHSKKKKKELNAVKVLLKILILNKTCLQFGVTHHR